MKRILMVFAAATFFLALTEPLAAQPRPRYQDNRDDRYHSFGRGILDRVRADLARAERGLHYISPPDMRRFMNIREGLANFQRSWERGHYNRPELDQAISNLHALVDRGRLHPRDRDMLAGDLQELRGLQRRMERGPRS